jgi:hypothetical protein
MVQVVQAARQEVAAQVVHLEHPEVVVLLDPVVQTDHPEAVVM